MGMLRWAKEHPIKAGVTTIALAAAGTGAYYGRAGWRDLRDEAFEARARAEDEAAATEAARKDAEVAEASIRAMRLAAESVRVRAADPVLALLLAREAVAVAAEPEAVAAIHEALAANGGAVVILGHAGPLTAASFSPSGEKVLTASEDGTARTWDLEGRQVAVFRHEGAVRAARFSSDGGIVVTASADGTAGLWRPDGGPVAVLRHGGDVRDASFSPKGDRVLTASTDGTARLWDIDGRPVATLAGLDPANPVAMFSAEGHRVLTSSSEGAARMWGPDGKEHPPLGKGAAALRFALFLPGHRVLVCQGRELLFVSGPGGEVQTVLRGAPGEEMLAAVVVGEGPGCRVLAGTEDGTVRLFALGGPTAPLLGGHGGPVRAVAASGWTMVTASDDGTARLWDISGRCIGLLRGHGGPIVAAALSPSGEIALTASANGTARLWPTQTSALLQRADAILPRGPTAAERRRYAWLLEDVADRAAVASEEARVRNEGANNASWAIVKLPGLTAEEYRRGLALAESAVRQSPGDGNVLNTLGVARYRAGDLRKALATLRRSDRMNGRNLPADVAFIAMAAKRLGREDEARSEMERLRDLMEDPALGADPENAAFLREAEAVFSERR